MMRSFLAEVPKEILEAAEVDGAGLLTVLWRVVAPVAMPGLAATSLICFIFSWNELLFARVLTATVAQTAPVYLTGFVTSQGLFQQSPWSEHTRLDTHRRMRFGFPPHTTKKGI
jgi:sorbitol/mannitol transport system permease protein